MLRPSIAARSGYNARHPEAEIILDANENPYDLAPELKEKIFTRLKKIPFNRYPEANSHALRRLAAGYLGVDEDYIVIGNGSDELINYLISACVDPGDRVVFPEPSFSMYRILAETHHAEVVTTSLGDNWEITDELIEISREASLVFLGYPNNPTGNCFDPEKINELRRQTEGLVILDEAYSEFTGESWVEEVASGEPLVVLRTLSKAFGLAGIRTGFLIAPPPIVKGISTVKLPYNLNRLSQVTAEEALKNKGQILDKIETIINEREKLFEILENRGLAPYPTQANFILFKPPDAGLVYRKLLERGIRIRQFSDPLLSDCLRITVGTPAENKKLIKNIKEIV
ncbi:MAG: histidinol-phosphate transaminase [bacterium]